MEIKQLVTIGDVQQTAYEAHASVNHLYGGRLPYSFHLDKVADVAIEFQKELPHSVALEVVCACYLHDIMEDCRWTYNDVKTATNERIAEIVYAVTDELGRNRDERKARTLPKIAANRLAVFVKVCDRIANTGYSQESANESTKSASMYVKYCQEYPTFRSALYQAEEYPSLWAYADTIHGFNPSL